MPVVDSNREAFRELVREGMMIAGHSFAGGPGELLRSDRGREADGGDAGVCNFRLREGGKLIWRRLAG